MAIIRLISMNHEKDYSEDDDLEYKQLQSPSSSRYVRSLTVFFKINLTKNDLIFFKFQF